MWFIYVYLQLDVLRESFGEHEPLDDDLGHLTIVQAKRLEHCVFEELDPVRDVQLLMPVLRFFWPGCGEEEREGAVQLDGESQ